MVYDLTGYKTLGNFAKQYNTPRNGNKGSVDYVTIYRKVERELRMADSTDIDVIRVDGMCFVKYKGSDSVILEANQ